MFANSISSSPMMNSFSLLARTAPLSSNLGIVILCFGAILLFDMISIAHQAPDFNFHLIYAVVPKASIEPSEKTTRSGLPTTSSLGHKLRGNSYCPRSCNSMKNSTICFTKLPGRGSSHLSSLQSPSQVCLKRILALRSTGASNPIGSKSD